MKMQKSKVLVHRLEETVIKTLRNININSNRSPDTGVWVENDKICAMGMQIQKDVSSHGMALNCDIDLKWFEYIVPCGLVGKGVTTVTKLRGEKFQVDDVIDVFTKNFESEFRCSIESSSSVGAQKQESFS